MHFAVSTITVEQNQELMHITGMDPKEWCANNSVTRQPPPAPIRGEARKDTAIYDQGKGSDIWWSGQAVGGAGIASVHSVLFVFGK